MNTISIIQQGERAKYIVTSNRQDFDFGENDYSLELLFGMSGRKVIIPKSGFQELDGHWVFSFDTSEMVGKVMARLVMNIDGRQEVDEQYIAMVITSPCPQFLKCPKCAEVSHDVTYIRTEESDIGERYAILCDCNGTPIVTTDDEYLCVLRTIIKQ